MRPNPNLGELEGPKPIFEPSPEKPPKRVAQIWAYRERIEIEAAAMFGQMAEDLLETQGRDAVTQMAEAASTDERRHAVLCRNIINEFDPRLTPHAPRAEVSMGPAGLTISQRALYSCVAASCVTETLSTALLIEMRNWAGPKIIRETIAEILEDEISHSRLGWAQLAQVARQVNVAWLGDYLSQMIDAALVGDIRPMVSPQPDLSRWGILGAEPARRIMHETLQTVILPGLAQHGICRR